MDPKNALFVYIIENNIPISKKEIEFNKYVLWSSFDDVKNCFPSNIKKIKYFDEEGELISLHNYDDFTVFKELLLDKPFPREEVIIIAYEGILNIRKFGKLDKISKLKLDFDCSTIFDPLKSVESSSTSVSMHQNANYNTSSSTSSDSMVIRKRKPQVEKCRKSKLIMRYAAKLKKELNYLSGSEVSDGQTIIKRWRIKNVGSKKWKENSVKSVLLPSLHSDWITCSQIRVPVCFADQKVDIEMEISINGLWDINDSCSNECSQDICLTWLLFKDNLLKESNDNFKDYIFTQLELSIVVRKMSHNSDFRSSTTNIELKKHLSESSIERIENDYSFVDISDEDRVNKQKFIDSNEFEDDTDKKVTGNNSEEIEIELQECPQVDNSPLSDFHNPNGFISVETEDVVKSSIENDSIPVNLSKSGDVENIEQIDNASMAPETLECKDVEEVTVIKSNAICEEITVKNDDEELLIFHSDESSRAEVIAITKIDELPYNSTNTQEMPISIDDNEEYNYINVQEIPLETNFTEISYSIRGDNQMNSECLKNDMPDVIKDNKESADLQDGSSVKEHIEVLESDGMVQQKEESNNADVIETDSTQSTELSITNNSIDQCLDNPNQSSSRQMPIDCIRNEFPRSNNDTIVTSQYLPGYLYPVINPNTNYIAGVGRPDLFYQHNTPATNYPLTNFNNCSQLATFPRHNYPPIAPTHTYTPNENNIIENLRRNGNLDVNINDSKTMCRAANGQHYLTTENMVQLKSMGFNDEERNYRLLMKFNNNINDVINDLID